MQGRVALVTGASSGIGRVTAALLAERGARVMAVARRGERLAELAAESGVHTHAVALDTADGCLEALTAARQQLGPVHILVCNAGLGSAHEPVIWEQTEEIWQRTMRINLDAPFHLLRLAAPDMIEAGYGRVVMIGSTASLAGSEREAAYTASKHGLLGLTRSAALDLAPHGITCNAVLPGWVATEMSDRSAAVTAERRGISLQQVWQERNESYTAGRIPTAEEVARTVAWLASEDASGVSGEAVRVALGSVW
ncbi:MAG TPA: SDR family oxidoreductase [Gaiellales bacterium]|nr:SDR family oxidoreductase [Gaiellales bacterium]